MSFYDDASLVFLPSGGAGKDTKAYSIKPTNGDGDFTFSRGSNLTATRVDSNGLIQKGRENLLLQSNQFDTTWGGNTSNRSITGGFSGYDGSNDAWKLEAISDNTYSVVAQLISNAGVETFSVYAKAGTSNFFRIQITGGTNSSASYFDLSGSGSVGNNFNNIDAKIESVGNGWFRCSVTGNKTTSSNCVVFVVDADGSTNVTTGANVYIQDAQLEQGLVATEYIESGASTGLAGILEDSPRFDYSGGASCPSLLLEPSRTNLVPQSEYFEDWSTQSSPSLSLTNESISPEGLYNSYRIDATANSSAIYQNFTTANGSDYTASVFLKTNGSTRSTLQNYQAPNAKLTFNWVNGEPQTHSNEFSNDPIYEDYGNGWYKISIAFTATDVTNRLYIYPDRVDASKSIFCYGAQLEQGSYPTSYIPNHSGGSVTREEDTTAELSLSSSYGSSNTWLFELKRITDTSLSNQAIAILKNDSTGASNRFTIYSTSGGRFRVLLSDENGTTENLFSPSDGFEKGQTIKAAVKITSSGCTLFIDGSSVDTSSSVGTITGIDAITYFKKAALKQFLIFPSALSDAECITLTS